MYRERVLLLAILAFVMLFSVARISQAQLLIDFDDRAAADPVNTEPGYEQFLIDGTENDDQATTTRTFGSIDVTVSHPNSAVNLYGDRRRGEPTNFGDFSEQELLRDFIFARGETADDGLDIMIANLTPDADYDVRIWSYDTSSNGDRISDWTANGVLVQDDYTFAGEEVPPDPVDNNVYAFDFSSTTDSGGGLLIQGRAVAGNGCCAVFLNALRLVERDFIVGDFNGDGQVNSADFDVMADNMYGHLDGNFGHQFGDFNLDNRTDLFDFHEFIEANPAAAAGAVQAPEPTSLLLGTITLLGLISARRRVQRRR